MSVFSIDKNIIFCYTTLLLNRAEDTTRTGLVNLLLIEQEGGMTTTYAKEAFYVIFWDYDPTDGYFPWKCWKVLDLAEGKAQCFNALDDGVPGAGVYQGGQLLKGWNGCSEWPFGPCQ